MIQNRKKSAIFKKKNFKFVNKRDVLSDIRVFNARFVNEIRNENTKKTYKKSRLIIQTYNNSKKNQIFIQLSIIQRMNQRLILCIVVMIESDSIKLYFRNITQTYVQSIFIFNRNFYVKSFHKFVKIMKTLFDCILKMMKLLYEIFETNNHWFFIYHKHHIERFVMIESIYDSCLFHCIELFVAINFQINDILIFVNDDFAIKKNEIIKTINIMFKQRECFIIINSIKFNDMKIKLSENETISMKHASNVKSISLIKNYESSIISFRNVVKKNWHQMINT